MKKNIYESLIPTPIHRFIAPKTKEHYGKIINLLHKSTLESQPYSHIIDATPLEIVEYLYAQRARFRPQTFLMYRTALIWWIPTITVNQITQSAWSFLHEPLPIEGYKDEKGVEGNTTLYSKRSSRKRTVSRKNFNKLLDELTQRTDNARTHVERRRASELRYWLMAGLATGLRPVEWSQAHWRDKQAGELYVMTAKRKMGNYGLPSISHLQEDEYMPTRVVRLDDEKDVLWVDLHMKSVQAFLQSGDDKTFSRYYNNNRLYLRSVCISIFPKDVNVTLYMLRGQFAANRKISGQPREELSEEMGCSPFYISSAYGKQIHGYKDLKGSRLSEQEKRAEEEAQMEQNAQDISFDADSFQGGDSQNDGLTAPISESAGTGLNSSRTVIFARKIK